MDKEKIKYQEHLKLESEQRIYIPDGISVEKREELNLLNDDPYGHFLKYVQPFLTPEDIEDVEENLFDLGAFDEEKEEK